MYIIVATTITLIPTRVLILLLHNNGGRQYLNTYSIVHNIHL